MELYAYRGPKLYQYHFNQTEISVVLSRQYTFRHLCCALPQYMEDRVYTVLQFLQFFKTQ